MRKLNIFICNDIREEKFWHRFIVSQWAVSSRNYIQKASVAKLQNWVGVFFVRDNLLLLFTYGISLPPQHLTEGRTFWNLYLSAWLWLLPLNFCILVCGGVKQMQSHCHVHLGKPKSPYQVKIHWMEEYPLAIERDFLDTIQLWHRTLKGSELRCLEFSLLMRTALTYLLIYCIGFQALMCFRLVLINDA